MADSKISALTEKLSFADNDVTVIVDSVGGLNKKLKKSNMGFLTAAGSVTGATVASQPFTIGVTTPLVQNAGDLDLTAGGNVGVNGDSFVITSTLTGAVTAGSQLDITAIAGKINMESVELDIHTSGSVALLFDDVVTINAKTTTTSMTLADAIVAGDKIIVNGLICEP